MRVANGCTLCSNDVLGTMESGFFCRKCNILFNKRQVNFKNSRARCKALIKEHFADITFSDGSTLEVGEIELPAMPQVEELAEQVHRFVKGQPVMERVLEQLQEQHLTIPRPGRRKVELPKKQKSVKKAATKQKKQVKDPKKQAKKTSQSSSKSARRVTKRSRSRLPPVVEEKSALDDML